ncbi:NAD(P)/FAD-dependent oxidoreductase [Nocardiopsis alba]|uniref:NAD(P)/FAD-dependent oxidoreductase n=1 Tax=Nocardiopsis alba TaxID=53437 RepID=UPI00366D5BC5
MTHELLVLGAGYAGLAAAGRAARDARALDLRVTLVDVDPRFVERVRLHQIATGQDVGVHPLGEALDGTGIDLVAGRVEGIDAATRTVTVRADDGPRPLRYDTLIHALGSTAAPSPVPGVAEHAFDVATLEGARRLAERVREEPPRTLIVVGGGHTGVETAAEFAESRPDLRVTLLSRGQIGPAVGRRGRAHLRRALRRLGVIVREHATVTEVASEGVRLADGTRIDGDPVVWSAGLGVRGPLVPSGMALDDQGRALVDLRHRSLSHPEILVVGDAAHTPGADGTGLRMSCAMALPTGWSAADTVTADLHGREAKGTAFGYLFQCVSLGRRDGLIQFVRADDTPTGFVLTGRPAALYKEYIVASAANGALGRRAKDADLYLSLVRRAARRFTVRSRGMGAVQDGAPARG